MNTLSALDPLLIQKKILQWFDLHGRKSLPWQQNKNPYRVWISEIMLQQTQVKTVIDYFQRFMQRFPNLETLATSSCDEVLLYWAGLGYYSRARNLYKTAQILHLRGEFPDTVSELSQLPGIGRSTAGAIIAIAYNKPATILDGNVKRVLARLHAITDPVNEPTTEKKLWELAEHYTSKRRPGDYAQAMMDLGATCCLRKKPQCGCCPLQAHCAAAKQGVAEVLPVKKRTAAKPIRQATFLIVRAGKKTLLQHRPEKKIWGGLWSFPEISGKAEESQIRLFCREQYAIPKSNLIELPAFRHTFTHYHLDIFPVIVKLPKVPLKLKKMEWHIWVEQSAEIKVAVPKPVAGLLKRY